MQNPIEIQCECGKFRAHLTKFPKETPGRLICYCDDCQSFLHHLKRSDLLDVNGGTEIIPIYPSDIKILQGKDVLRCTRLISYGMFRYHASCCNTPIGNTDEKRPWLGLHRIVFTAKDPNQLDQLLKKIAFGVMGKFAHGQLPQGTAEKFNFKAFVNVMPFIIKGVVLGRNRPSPFFEGKESIVKPHILPDEDRKKSLAASSNAK